MTDGLLQRSIDRDCEDRDMTMQIVIAAIGANLTSAALLPELIGKTHAALAALGSAPPEPEAQGTPKREPAVTERKSLASPDHIISMIDGKPYKTLRRHLSTFGYTPESYREAFGLKPSYPMVAPSYSEARRAMAKKIGLGTQGNRAGG